MSTQRWARVAGFLFLWLIVAGLGGAMTIARITGSGTFAEVAQRVAASERLYRVALCLELIGALSALILAFALYVILRPFDKLLAQFAMSWRVAEASIGAAGMLFAFVKLRLFVAPEAFAAFGGDRAQALLILLRQAGAASYNISATFFGIGSLIFFYLFYKSRTIPRTLATIGIFASVVVPIMCLATLIFPEHGSWLQYGWAPMAIAEVGTGIWLLIFGLKPVQSGVQAGNQTIGSRTA